jgi:pilus assembly protein CpaF
MASFTKEWEEELSGYELILDRQKKAIIGYEKEVKYFRDKIEEYLKRNACSDYWFPEWYVDLTDAVFQENWGLAGVSEWVKGEKGQLSASSSAKIIGDRIYFLIDGKLVLQPQRIGSDRRKQLRKALLLNTPRVRDSDDYHEIYMMNGTRITLFGNGKTKENQDTIIFRKFFVKDYTFEKQVELGTVPNKLVPVFKEMIKCGYNVAFTGAVRTAKTTFLTTWQSYENPELEGVSIETDPEIPLHKIMPTAPILQLVADGEELEQIVKSVMRSDADYIVLGEARDGIALNIAVKIANKGTRRVKLTYHTSDPIDFCYDVADEIVKAYGGSLYSTVLKVAKSFQFIFHFVQLKDKSKKRLNSIYNLEYNPFTHEVAMHRICRYLPDTDDWVYQGELSEWSMDFGLTEDKHAALRLKNLLKDLSEENPETKAYRFVPALDHLKAAR